MPHRPRSSNYEALDWYLSEGQDLDLDIALAELERGRGFITGPQEEYVESWFDATSLSYAEELPTVWYT